MLENLQERSPGGPRYKWEDNVKWILHEYDGGMDLFNWLRVRSHWWAFVNSHEPLGTIKAGHFLTKQATINF
jgi:hypothetical protein